MFFRKKLSKEKREKIYSILEIEREKNFSLKESLEKVIISLENKTVLYNWNNCSVCNCGLVVKELLHVDLKSMDTIVNAIKEEVNLSIKYKTTWEGLVNRSCNETSLPLTKIFSILSEKGLTPHNIIHLENLSDPKILAKIDKNIINFVSQTDDSNKNKYFLLEYLKAWVKLLEEKEVKISKVSLKINELVLN